MPVTNNRYGRGGVGGSGNGSFVPLEDLILTPSNVTDQSLYDALENDKYTAWSVTKASSMTNFYPEDVYTNSKISIYAYKANDMLTIIADGTEVNAISGLTFPAKWVKLFPITSGYDWQKYYSGQFIDTKLALIDDISERAYYDKNIEPYFDYAEKVYDINNRFYVEYIGDQTFKVKNIQLLAGTNTVELASIPIDPNRGSAINILVKGYGNTVTGDTVSVYVSTGASSGTTITRSVIEGWSAATGTTIPSYDGGVIRPTVSLNGAQNGMNTSFRTFYFTLVVYYADQAKFYGLPETRQEITNFNNDNSPWADALARQPNLKLNQMYKEEFIGRPTLILPDGGYNDSESGEFVQEYKTEYGVPYNDTNGFIEGQFLRNNMLFDNGNFDQILEPVSSVATTVSDTGNYEGNTLTVEYLGNNKWHVVGHIGDTPRQIGITVGETMKESFPGYGVFAKVDGTSTGPGIIAGFATATTISAGITGLTIEPANFSNNNFYRAMSSVSSITDMHRLRIGLSSATGDIDCVVTCFFLKYQQVVDSGFSGYLYTGLQEEFNDYCNKLSMLVKDDMVSTIKVWLKNVGFRFIPVRKIYKFVMVSAQQSNGLYLITCNVNNDDGYDWLNLKPRQRYGTTSISFSSAQGATLSSENLAIFEKLIKDIWYYGSDATGTPGLLIVATSEWDSSKHDMFLNNTAALINIEVIDYDSLL